MINGDPPVRRHAAYGCRRTASNRQVRVRRLPHQAELRLLLAKIIVRRQGGLRRRRGRPTGRCPVPHQFDTNIDFLHQVLQAPAFAASR
jgi:hypothetical protein